MRSTMSSSTAIRNVLLVDDNDGDASLVRISAEDFINLAITHVPNGVQALRYLSRKSPFEDCPKPDLVLLDLRMPTLDGSVVLQAMRESADHRETPIVVFTTSSDDEGRCRRLGATDYAIKPLEWSAWESTVRTILRRYLFDDAAAASEGKPHRRRENAS